MKSSSLCVPVSSLFDWAQLPRFREVLAQVCPLIKPEGHLILEEINARAYSEHRETPDVMNFFHDRTDDWVSQRDETYDVGRELQPYISKLGMLIDFTGKVLVAPFSPGWARRKFLNVIVTHCQLGG